jgi:hypothetical protein
MHTIRNVRCDHFNTLLKLKHLEISELEKMFRPETPRH